MNAPVRPPLDLPHRLFTTEDVFRMVQAGVLAENENIELIDGEIVVMAAKKNAHEITKSILIEQLARTMPGEMRLGVETTLYLTERLFVEPDLMLYPRRIKPEDLSGEHIALLIEVADESRAYDLGVKAGIYAQHGVADYWVVDVLARRAVVHRRPSDDGYRSIEVVEGDLKALLLPDLRIALASLFEA
ncbi:hypothetical protein AS593_19195 [Caulobacter vibrioides]|nr:hypothetical protein AS593_19195 [Caulobacter vibrioides]